jgi:DUF1680 family protein
MLIDTRKSQFAKVYAPPQEAISLREGFWKDRFDRCADITIPHVLSVFDDSDSFFHQVENFRIAAGLSDGEFRGTPFGDGDFYKLMEGMVYAYAKRRDPQTDRKLDAFIELIAKAQQPDGYLSTKQIIGERHSNGVHRHGDVNDFEEYNFGHLFTAACMHKRVTGKDSFMHVAERVADYLENMYARILESGKPWTAVCPSHYMGLIEMYRTTGSARYLSMAKTAIDLRDSVENGTDDNQDRIPLREQRTIVGHAVRSTYLYAGVADLYLENGDETLLPVINNCWDNLMNKKLYVNGGCGALYTGTSPFGMFFEAQQVHQAFGYEYQLPNVTAYNETCGTLGHIFWAHRMFAIKPEAKYFDLIERSSYNLALAAVSLDGDKYFYENMLRRTKKVDYPLIWPLERSSFFKCFCCPTNLSRYIMQMSEYAYMLSDDAVWLGVYGASEAKLALKNGARFTLVQQTDYPWDGEIRLGLKDIRSAQPFTLKLRIPGWLESGSLLCGGTRRALSRDDADTYLDVRINPAEVPDILLSFDMPARLTIAHPMVEEAVNQVCVERGPLVYCMESPDAQVESIDEVMIPSDASFTPIPYEIMGQKLLALETHAVRLVRSGYQPDLLYQQLQVSGMQQVSARLIPYFAWDNRGYGEMRIWIPVIHRF